MRNYILVGFVSLGIFLGSFGITNAVSTFIIQQGGTGTTSPSGILYGDNGATSHLNTVSIGSNLTFSGGTLSATGGGGNTGLATTTPWSTGNLAYVVDNGHVSSVATTTASCSGSVSCSSFTVVGSVSPTITSSALTAAVTSIGPAGQLQTGPAVTLATTTTTTNGLTTAETITATGNMITWKPSISGTLTVAGGGTGVGTFTSGQLIYGNGTNALSSVGTSTPTVSAPITYSGTLGSFVGGVGGAFACTTASAGVTGCLSGTDWSTFNSKQAALTFSYPLVNTTNTISLAFGTTTSNTWAGTQTFTNSPIFSTLGLGTVNSNVAGNLYNTATTSVSSGSGVSFTGTAGALIGGSSLTINNTGVLSLQQLGGGTAQTGALTLSTTTDTVNGLTYAELITNTGAAFTFANSISGTLQVGGGGTGVSSLASGHLLYGSGSTAMTDLAPGTAGQVLGIVGGVPAWVATSTAGGGSGTVTSIVAGTGLTGGTITTSGTIALSVPVSIANGGTATSTYYSGGLVFYDGTELSQAPNKTTSALNWDNTDGTLGIGTTTTSSSVASAAVMAGVNPQLALSTNSAGAVPDTIGASAAGVLILNGVNNLQLKSSLGNVQILNGATIEYQQAGVAFRGNITNSPAFENLTCISSTVPNIVPNFADTTTGLGCGASGNINFIASGVEVARFSSNGLNVGTTTGTYGGSSWTNAVSNAVSGLGGILIDTATNVTNALTIKNAAGTSVFNVDTTAANPFLGIGTSTPFATLSVAGNGTNPLFAVATSSSQGLPNFEIDNGGHMITSGPKPAISGGTSTLAGNDNNGTITVTGTLLTSVTVTFVTAWATAPDCTMSDNSTGITADITSISTTQVVFGFSTGINSGTVWYQCRGHQ